jgi:hypothetical protein
MRTAYENDQQITLAPQAIGMVIETLNRCYAAEVQLSIFGTTRKSDRELTSATNDDSADSALAS